jgi:hypothetical protein
MIARLKKFRPILAATMALLIFACASGPDVRVDYDRATDFTQYKTFGFADPLGTDRSGYQSIVSKYLKAASQRELEARGIRYVTKSPQLIVNFNARLNEKARVTTTPTTTIGVGVGGGHGYYGYRAGVYSAWPLYQDQTTVTPYTEGTLNIDIADAARKQLVWEGVVTGTVTKKTQDNMQAAMEAAVTAAFAKFPIAAPPRVP